VNSDVKLLYLPSSLKKKRDTSACSLQTQQFSKVCTNLTNIDTCNSNDLNDFVKTYVNESVSNSIK
jgi:peroxiredoxin